MGKVPETKLSSKQKMKLLEESQMFEVLTFKQIITLLWWESFNPKKLNKFYTMLQIGKAVQFAFKDAQCCHYGIVSYLYMQLPIETIQKTIKQNHVYNLFRKFRKWKIN